MWIKMLTQDHEIVNSAKLEKSCMESNYNRQGLSLQESQERSRWEKEVGT